MLEIVSSSDDTDTGMIDVITGEYNKLLEDIDFYQQQLKKEVEERELDKHDLFKASSLNIKLSKYRGYDSNLDIYTFQSEFEKIYNRTTPKRLLPDLLKNNLLDGPALSLVKSVDDIDEIWARLKLAYGDSKLLLSKKLNEAGTFGPLWKIRDPE